MSQRLLRLLLLFLCSIALCLVPLPSRATWPGSPQPPALMTAQLTNAATLEQQGRSHYDSGQFDAAIQAFQQAAQAYQAQGDSLRQAISLSNLSLAYQQVGGWPQATAAIAESLTLLQTQPRSSSLPERSLALAHALDIQGSLQLAQGQAEAALTSWKQASDRYIQLRESDRATDSQINQAQALQTLGLYRRAIATLLTTLNLALGDPAEPLLKQLQALPTTATTATGLQSLGAALRATGNLSSASLVLQRSLAIAERLQRPELIAATRFNLANVNRAQAVADLNLAQLALPKALELIAAHKGGQQFRQTDTALKFDRQMQAVLQQYQQAATAAAPTTQIQAQLNQLSLLIELQQWADVQLLLPSLQQQIERLPSSHTAIEARINLAQSLIQLNRPDAKFVTTAPISLQAAQLLTATIQQAKALNDDRGQAYALGWLGHLYEQSQQWPQAQTVTQQAILLAQSIQATDITYVWQWQLGRLLKAQGQKRQAIAAYQAAVIALKTVRDELVTTALEEQFSFRDQIEPLHRELVTLLLEAEPQQPQPENLKTARDVIESLQLTELINFFHENCLSAQLQPIDQADPTAAVIYPILLADRLAVIANLPGQALTYYATAPTAQITAARIEASVSRIRASLNQANTPESDYLPAAEDLYDWLIRPIAAELQARSIKTIVFVLDGALRNLPMSILHDRQQNQFLIEQYSIALTPGLQLFSTSPAAQTRSAVLLAGLTEARLGFPPLPQVATELAQIKSQLPASQVLQDQQFTNQNFQADVGSKPFRIVHLATHGQFSSQLENTFILTWNERLDVNQLKTLLQTAGLNQQGALELLVLSACETAAGDDRSALGLAGVAVRSGARSTIATLWQVNDLAAAKLMGQFYRSFGQAGVTKAEALRQAQLSLLKDPQTQQYQRPYYWAPYVLVGHWQ